MSLLYWGHPAETSLALFAGGELGPLSRWRIEKHLQDCASCQHIVADFFHLQSDLSELSLLPALDWDAMTAEICERAAETAPSELAPRPFLSPPMMWRYGLVTATLFCAFVVVRQFPFEKSPQESALSAMLAEQDAPLVQEKLSILEDADDALKDTGETLKGASRLSGPVAAMAPQEEEIQAAESQERATREISVVGQSRGFASAAKPATASSASAPGDPRSVRWQVAPEQDVNAQDMITRGAPARAPAPAPANESAFLKKAVLAPVKNQPAEPPAKSGEARKRALTKRELGGEYRAESPEGRLRDATQKIVIAADTTGREIASADAPEPVRVAEAAGTIENFQTTSQIQPQIRPQIRTDDESAADAGAGVRTVNQRKETNEATEKRKSVVMSRAVASETESPLAAPASSVIASASSLRPPGLGAAEPGAAGRGASGRSASAPALVIGGNLSIMPVSLEGSEIGVTADGWLRVRHLDARTGNVMITDIYAQ